MRTTLSLILSFIILPLTALAGAVLYTDSQHLPTSLPSDTQLVLLDQPDLLLAEIFGQLPADPQQAFLQTKQTMHFSGWHEKQQQLTESYRQIAHVWQLGLAKYPAIVFDDTDVVYGTTDIGLAEALRAQGSQQ